MDWRDVALLRAFGRYHPPGRAVRFSPDYMAQTLVKHGAHRAATRVGSFKALFDPASADETRQAEALRRDRDGPCIDVCKPR